MKATWIVAAIIVGCSSAAGLVTSRLYWGYWFSPPSADWMVSPIVSVDRFTTFACCSPNRSGLQALHDAAKVEFHGSGDAPSANLPAALVRRGLDPGREEAVPAAVLTTITGVLDSRGALVEGEPGYTLAKELWGHVALGRNAQGADLVVAALAGGEVSNDHHSYYEAAFAGSSTGEWKPARCPPLLV